MAEVTTFNKTCEYEYIYISNFMDKIDWGETIYIIMIIMIF